MGEIVNLRQSAKEVGAARKDRETEAAANRAKFGQTKAERALRQDAEAEKPCARHLDRRRSAKISAER